MESILYDQRTGNPEFEPNTLRVSLTKWVASLEMDDEIARSHYTLTAKVTINFEVVVNQFEATPATYTNLNDDAEHIRKAIARFDELLDLNPEVRS